MKGMYCPACRESGPDLLVDAALIAPDGTIEPVIGTHTGRFEFDCTRCGRHCRWYVTVTANGVTYEQVQ